MTVFNVKSPFFKSICLCWRVKFSVEFDPGCEAMIYSVDGTPLQGLPPTFPINNFVKKFNLSQVSRVASVQTAASNTSSPPMLVLLACTNSSSNPAAMACSVFLGMATPYNLRIWTDGLLSLLQTWLCPIWTRGAYFGISRRWSS